MKAHKVINEGAKQPQRAKKHPKSKKKAKNEECSVCGRSFVTRRELKAHIGLKHEPQLFRCDLCQSKFKTQQQVTIHRVIHFGK
jgi:ribosomal protein S14